MFIKSREKRREQFLDDLGWYIVNISKVIFNVSFITFVIYFIIEHFKVGLISNYFDLNSLLILACLSGIIVIFFNEKEVYSTRKKQQSLLIIFILAISAGILSYQYLQNLKFLSYLIAILASILVFYSLILFFNRTQSND
ncbi:hypothetical protein KKF32_04250 [Patescibacteria group bacterium]|nr:hypothetical protein [Patescibacteria group bacterium]